MDLGTTNIAFSSPHIGAEIVGIDLRKPLSPSDINRVVETFVQRQVVFFRDQELDANDLARVASYFGPLMGHVGAKSNSQSTGNPFVRRFHFDEHSEQSVDKDLHSDQSCAPVPPAVSLLYNHTLPRDGGGDTLFANMYAAYEALSPRMQRYLEGLTATHDGTRAYAAGSPISSHPVVVRHPDSGRKALFVNAGFTTKINDLPAKEGKRVLEFLFDHCDRPEWTCRFRWEAHSIAVWDNRCTLHRALFDYWPQVRSGFRVYVAAAEAPIAG